MLTDFQKKVLNHIPDWPSERSITRIVSKVYDDGWQGRRKARGRRVAVIKALQKLREHKLVNWDSHILSNRWREEYWYKNR